MNGLDLSPYVVKDPGTGVGTAGGEGNSRPRQQQQQHQHQQEQQPQQLNHHGHGHQRAKEDAPETSPLATAPTWNRPGFASAEEAAAAAASAGEGVASGVAAAPAASAHTNGAVYGKTAKEGVGEGVGGGGEERLARPFFLSGPLDDLGGGGGNEGSDSYARTSSAAARAAGAANGAAGGVEGGDEEESWLGEGEGDAMLPETVEAGAEAGDGAGMGNPGVIGANVSIFQGELALVLASAKYCTIGSTFVWVTSHHPPAPDRTFHCQDVISGERALCF